MKKEYLTPDVWVLDFAAACMQAPGQTTIPISGVDPTEIYDAPGRRSTAGPASL